MLASSALSKLLRAARQEALVHHSIARRLKGTQWLIASSGPLLHQPEQPWGSSELETP